MFFLLVVRARVLREKRKTKQNNANGQKDFRNGMYIVYVYVFAFFKNKMEDKTKYL